MNKKGFTLIEFLIYISIVGFVIGALTLSGINIMHGRAEVRSMEEVEENARFVFQKITYLIRNANSIKSISSDSLSLNLNESGAEYVDIYLDGATNNVMVNRNTSTISQLTTSSVEVTNLSFSQVYNNAIQISLTINFNNQTGRREYDFERTFRTIENIRE